MVSLRSTEIPQECGRRSIAPRRRGRPCTTGVYPSAPTTGGRRQATIEQLPAMEVRRSRCPRRLKGTPSTMMLGRLTRAAIGPMHEERDAHDREDQHHRTGRGFSRPRSSPRRRRVSPNLSLRSTGIPEPATRPEAVASRPESRPSTAAACPRWTRRSQTARRFSSAAVRAVGSVSCPLVPFVLMRRPPLPDLRFDDLGIGRAQARGVRRGEPRTDDLAVFEHEDLVGVDDGRYSLGDHQHRRIRRVRLRKRPAGERRSGGRAQRTSGRTRRSPGERASARAMHNRWRWPPDTFVPPWVIKTVDTLGHGLYEAAGLRNLQRLPQIGRRRRRARPSQEVRAPTVPENRNGFWGT